MRRDAVVVCIGVHYRAGDGAAETLMVRVGDEQSL